MAPQTLDLTEAYIHDDVFSNKGRRRARFSAPEGLDKLSSWEELQERPPLDVSAPYLIRIRPTILDQSRNKPHGSNFYVCRARTASARHQK